MILITLSFSCKTQEITKHRQIDNYNTNIIGIWIHENDANYKLEFLSNGTCKEYESNVLLTTYNYSIESNSCDTFSASNTIYLKWVDSEDSEITCLEISNITEDSLSLMIIEKAKILFFNKQ